MTRGRGTLLVVLSVLPPLAVLGLWYAMAEAHRAADALAYRDFLAGRKPAAAADEWLWVLNLLPAVVFLSPVLPVAVLGKVLGQRHREDYTGGVVAVGITLCGVALVLGVLGDWTYTPRGRLPGPPQKTGRVVEVAAPVALAGTLAGVGIAAAVGRRRERRRRREWVCVACGYNLRGNPWQCAECGRTYVPGRPPEEAAAAGAAGGRRGGAT